MSASCNVCSLLIRLIGKHTLSYRSKCVAGVSNYTGAFPSLGLLDQVSFLSWLQGRKLRICRFHCVENPMCSTLYTSRYHHLLPHESELLPSGRGADVSALALLLATIFVLPTFLSEELKVRIIWAWRRYIPSTERTCPNVMRLTWAPASLLPLHDFHHGSCYRFWWIR